MSSFIYSNIYDNLKQFQKIVSLNQTVKCQKFIKYHYPQRFTAQYLHSQTQVVFNIRITSQLYYTSIQALFGLSKNLTKEPLLKRINHRTIWSAIYNDDSSESLNITICNHGPWDCYPKTMPTIQNVKFRISSIILSWHHDDYKITTSITNRNSFENGILY